MERKLFYDESRLASDLVDERLFFTYSMLNTAATPLHNAQPWRLFMLVFWSCTMPDTYQKQALGEAFIVHYKNKYKGFPMSILPISRRGGKRTVF